MKERAIEPLFLTDRAEKVAVGLLVVVQQDNIWDLVC